MNSPNCKNPIKDNTTVCEWCGANFVSQSIFCIGETVKIVDGSFNNFSGIIKDVNNEQEKLKVTVKIFGRQTPLDLNFTQIEKN